MTSHIFLAPKLFSFSLTKYVFVTFADIWEFVKKQLQAELFEFFVAIFGMAAMPFPCNGILYVSFCCMSYAAKNMLLKPCLLCKNTPYAQRLSFEGHFKRGRLLQIIFLLHFYMGVGVLQSGFKTCVPQVKIGHGKILC